jgi:hypothetical protein
MNRPVSFSFVAIFTATALAGCDNTGSDTHKLTQRVAALEAKVAALESRRYVITSQVDQERIVGNNNNADCGDAAALTRLRYSVKNSDYAVQCRTFSIEAQPGR